MIRRLLPKYIAHTVWFLGGWAVLQMSIQLMHQLNDIMFKTAIIQNVVLIIDDFMKNHSIVELIMNGMIIYSLYRISWFIGKQLFMQYKWSTFFRKHLHTEWTAVINEQYAAWNIPIQIVRDESAIALSMGWIRPRIILSTGLLELIKDEELEAVLLHEKHHCLNRDPMKLMLMRLARAGFGYVPVIYSLERFYSIWVELLADRYVIQNKESSTSLGRALLVLIKSGKQLELGASFTGSSMNYRIHQLVEPNNDAFQPRIPLKSVIWSIIILIAMSFITIFMSFQH